jgi:hypothetical protein
MRPQSTAVARIAPDALPTPRRKRSKDVTVAVVHVLNPSSCARLAQAQDLGYPLCCAYRNGKLHVWTTEEAKR